MDNESDWLKPGGPKSRENCIKFLINKGCDVNEKDYHDYTALHYATMWEWNSTVRYLLDKKADVNAVTVSGKSALMMAVEYRYESVVRTIASNKNVQIDLPDSDGYTPLIRAIERGEEWFDIAKLLLEKGASPNVSTLRRKTPLKIACGGKITLSSCSTLPQLNIYYHFIFLLQKIIGNR